MTGTSIDTRVTERRAHVVLDDGTEVEVRWEPGAKFVLTVDDRATVAAPAVVTETPAVEAPAADSRSALEQRHAPNLSRSEDLRA